MLSSVQATAACRVPARTEANAAAFAVLGSMVPTRALFQSLRDGLGLYVADAHLSFLDGATVGMLEVQVWTPPDRAAAVVDATRKVVRAVHAGVPASALSWGQLTASAALTHRAASAHEAHDLLLEAAREGRSLESLTRLRTEIGAVSAASPHGAARGLRGTRGRDGARSRGSGLEGDHLDWVEHDRRNGRAPLARTRGA